MSKKLELSILITLKPANDPVHKPPAKKPQCDLFSHYNDPLCFSAGCRENVFAPPDKGEKQ
ncbi:MAG: hypothetical protein KUF77_09705 [Candidatus Thiodiazotropha sp. (ex Lucina aurantia)]|nr:hypothetical protein [Candidatus Thiodiazotropha sp. (ex Lucina aurantia)]MBV2116353.1 hypothetical protein [Candidatus Thiodiazotropha sp. (ex Lucina aurantia)]